MQSSTAWRLDKLTWFGNFLPSVLLFDFFLKETTGITEQVLTVSLQIHLVAIEACVVQTHLFEIIFHPHPCGHTRTAMSDVCVSERGTGKGLSKEKIAEIQSQIEADRRRLEGQKDMAEEEKRKVEEDLAQKESELAEAELVSLIYMYFIYSHILSYYYEKAGIH